MKYGSPILYKRVEIPPEFCVTGEYGTYGGDIRMGDLEGKGRADFLVYRSVDDWTRVCIGDIELLRDNTM